ncbi:MAG TPA: SPOR domain-containing protein, partial [Burkholderiaceae bacterium]|nr:SPOR domain-containing protein [Burkholderiaceae bacterium]
VVPEQREPHRATQQIAPGKIELVDPNAAPKPAPAAKTSLDICVEVGPLAFEDAERLATRIVAIGGSVQIFPPADAVSYMVHLPPLPTRAEADRLAAQLRTRGIADLQVLNEPASFRNAISLGLFRSQEAADTFVAQLAARGIDNTRVIKRVSALTRATMEVRGIAADANARFEELLKEAGTAKSGRACSNAR